MWTEVVISCPKKAIRNVLNQVGICIRDIEKQEKLLAWHYFLNEPWGTIVVRVETPDKEELPAEEAETKFSVSAIFEDHVHEPFTWIRYGTYKPETFEYDIAWNDVKKFFQASSEIGLLMARGIGENSNFGPLFTPSKLVHTALNTWGFIDYESECAFHERKVESTKLLACLDKSDNLDWYHQVSKTFGSPKYKELRRWE